MGEGTGDLGGSQRMVAGGSVPSRNALFLCSVHREICSSPEKKISRDFPRNCRFFENMLISSNFPGVWVSEGAGDLEGSQEMVAVGSVPSRNALFLCLVHHKIFSSPEKSISREFSREIDEI